VAAAAAGPGVAAASRESAAPTAGSKRNREEVQGAQGGEGRETAGPSGSAEARAAPAAPARGEQIVIGNKRAGKQRALRQQGVYEEIQIGRGTVFGNMFAMRKGGNDRNAVCDGYEELLHNLEHADVHAIGRRRGVNLAVREDGGMMKYTWRRQTHGYDDAEHGQRLRAALHWP